jgi:SAM-dependent methyltransferase
MDHSVQRYWGEIPQPEMRTILQDAEGKGWLAAVQDSDLLTSSRKSYIVSPTRAAWWPTVGLGPGSSVLDVGCGWASIADPLSRVCQVVVGIEPVLERARFAALRKKQSNLENLHILRTDLLSAPLADRYFDVVVLNGVVEWLGQDGYPDPGGRQLEGLLKAKSLLRPGGHVCIGIENRYGIHYAFGMKDHCGLPFTSFMPRAIADLITRCLMRKPYVTLTYSYWGYRELLEKAGFTEIRIFASLPSYSMPRYLLPLDNDMGPLQYFAEKQFFPMADPEETNPAHRASQIRWAQLLYWGTRLLGRSPELVRLLAPFFTISAMRGD